MDDTRSQTHPHTGETTLDQLLNDISHPDIKVRQQASFELGLRADLRAIPWLLQLLDHRYLIVQNSAFETLQRFGAASIPFLITNLNERRIAVRLKIIWLLGMFRSPAGIELLIAALDDPHDTIRSSAAHALGEIGEPSAFDALLRALHSIDIGLAAAAAIALGKLGDEQALAPLRIALRSPHHAVQIGATTGLGYLGNRKAVAELRLRLYETSADIRYAAVLALGRLGDPQVVPELAHLAHTDVGVSSDFEPIADTAAIVIGTLGGIWSVDALDTMLANTLVEDVYAWAIQGLSIVHPDTAVDVLIGQLHHAETFRRFHAAVALGVLGDQRAVFPLMEVAHTDTGITRTGALIADIALLAIERIREQKHDL